MTPMMLDQDLATILDMLPPDDARFMRQVLKHRGIIQTMLDSGIFNVKNGQVVMNFNDIGRLMKVDVHISAYNHGKFQPFGG